MKCYVSRFCLSFFFIRIWITNLNVILCFLQHANFHVFCFFLSHNIISWSVWFDNFSPLYRLQLAKSPNNATAWIRESILKPFASTVLKNPSTFHHSSRIQNEDTEFWIRRSIRLTLYFIKENKILQNLHEFRHLPLTIYPIYIQF